MPGITGGSRPYSVKTTTAAATAPRLHKQGYAFGSITNPTSNALSVVWYGAYSSTRTTARAAKDQDNVAVTQTIAAESIVEMHSALAGMPIVIPVTAAAATTVDIHVMFYR